MIAKTGKFNHKGQVISSTEDKNLLVWNALPNEKVEIEILKKKSGLYHAVATKVLTKSKNRIKPLEKSFLSTSPWQIIDWKSELKFKKEIVKELYHTLNIEIPSRIEIFSNNKQYNYRNKMEFSFIELENGQVSLAFFKRQGKGKIPVTGSKLAESAINYTAKAILKWINEQKIPIRSLKTVIVRSNGKGESIAGLFLKDRFEFETFPEINKKFLGLQIFYSTHKSPASVPTELLYSFGNNELESKVDGKYLKFGLFSFFQVNVPVFSKALKEIKKHIDKNTNLMDFYSGVGSISIGLSDKIKSAELIESSEEAVQFANENIKLNTLNGFHAHLIESEKALDYIKKGFTIVFDPPRTGLHQKVVEKVKEVLPEKIIYLSCGPETQARDINELKDYYKIETLKLYNFFPRTPHIESLAVLKLKN